MKREILIVDWRKVKIIIIAVVIAMVILILIGIKTLK